MAPNNTTTACGCVFPRQMYPTLFFSLSSMVESNTKLLTKRTNTWDRQLFVAWQRVSFLQRLMPSKCGYPWECPPHPITKMTWLICALPCLPWLFMKIQAKMKWKRATFENKICKIDYAMNYINMDVCDLSNYFRELFNHIVGCLVLQLG